MKNSLIFLYLLICIYSFSQNPAGKFNEMKEVLKQISIKSIELGDTNYELSKEQIDSVWIGFKQATRNEIENVEKRLGVKLPADYVEFLLITNGFSAANSVEPSFCAIDKVDFLKNVDPELYEIWIETGNLEVGNKLKTGIKIGGFDEEQYFFLIPPNKENPNWEYWVFAAWAPGETIYNSLMDYFKSVLETTNRFVDNKKRK